MPTKINWWALLDYKLINGVLQWMTSACGAKYFGYWHVPDSFVLLEENKLLTSNLCTHFEHHCLSKFAQP